MKIKAIAKKFLQALGVLAIVLVLVGLGNWQLDRAHLVQTTNAAAKVIDPKIYSLNELATPTVSLDSRNVNKRVAVSGFYIANFKAPLQSDSDGKVNDWEVALLQVDGSDPISAILVVRGLWADRLLNPEVAMSTKISLVGTMQPHQNDDRAENVPGVISRLDSSVIVGLADVALYDGFIVAKSEKTRDGELVRERVVAKAPVSRVAGYYWQHISYVAIWWLMAAIVIYLPFYRRKAGQ
ncbi:Surfeit locus 1/Shy1 [Candidatus Nanopelagicaceae bacterium]